MTSLYRPWIVYTDSRARGATNLDLGPDEVAVEQLPVVDAADLADVLSRLGVVHLTGLLTT